MGNINAKSNNLKKYNLYFTNIIWLCCSDSNRLCIPNNSNHYGVGTMGCDVARCKQPSLLIYADLPKNKEVSVCEKHWLKHCDEDDKFDLKKEFSK